MKLENIIGGIINKTKKSLKRLACAGIVVLALAGGVKEAKAATYYVPTDFSTIQGAINDSNVVDGDEIIVAPATYYENIKFNKKNIILRSEDPDNPDIVASTIIDGNKNGGVVFFNGGQDYSCVLEGFTITNGENNGSGGGIECWWRSSPTIRGNIIVDNSAYSEGGGIYCGYFSSPIIIKNTIRGNITNKDGGGIHCDESSPIIINNKITDNTALDDGGGIYCRKSSPTIINNKITDNTALDDGGGISCVAYSSSIIENNLITGNFALDGGGIFFHSCSPLITNNTITSNIAPDGGGIFCSSGLPRITNCILWGNTGDIYAGSATYSCIEDGDAGIGNTDMNPLFVDPNNNDYHLQPNSPCINTGDPNYVAEPNETDLDGNPRIIGGRIDMGVYESIPAIPAIKVAMNFTPQALNPDSRGNFKAHFVLPEDYTVSYVDTNTPVLVEPGNIPSEYVDAFVNEDGLAEIVASFDRTAFCGAGINGETIDIKATGSFIDGQQFYGRDIVKVTNNNLKYLGGLASYWLETNCDKPKWCNGFDLNQDHKVNFVDFSMSNNCYIEFVEKD